MNPPRVGFGLPTFGPHAGPGAVALVAEAAERLGFDSVSVTERLLLPAAESWVNTNGLPEWPVLDAIEALTFAAAHTHRIRLSTAIVNSLFQSPIVLARRLATLDQLSNGRLDVGIGQGWMAEEFAAVGVPMSRRGAGFEEHLSAMRACWSSDPVEHPCDRYPIARSRIGPKPVQAPLPLLLGAGSPVAIERAARLCAGLILAVWDWEVTRSDIGRYRDAAGAGPLVLAMVPSSRDVDPSTAARVLPPTMLDDLERAQALGADDVRWDLNLAGLDPDRQVDVLEAFAERRPSS